MPTSAWKRFAALFGKEMRELRPELIIVLVSAVFSALLIYIKSGTSRDILILPLFLLLGLAGLLPFVASFKLLGREFSSNTIYLVMSLPVSGGMILGSKLTALLCQYLLGTLAVAGGYLLWAYPHISLIENAMRTSLGISDGLSKVMIFLLMGYLQSIALLMYLVAISFFSQLAGKLVNRFSGLVTLGVFLATLYLGSHIIEIIQQQVFPQLSSGAPQRIGGIMAPLAAAGTVLPSQFFNQITQFFGINSGIFLGLALLIMILCVYVYNWRIEL